MAEEGTTRALYLFEDANSPELWRWRWSDNQPAAEGISIIMESCDRRQGFVLNETDRFQGLNESEDVDVGC